MTASARARMYDLRAVLWYPAFRDHHIHTVGFWTRRIAVGWTPGRWSEPSPPPPP